MKKILPALLLLLCLAPVTRAALILNENFNSYTNGAVTNQVGTPWTAYSGAGSSVVYVTNGQMRISTGTEDINATLTGAPYNAGSGTILYASFDLICTNLPNGAGDYFAFFKDTSVSGFRFRLRALTNGATVGGNFRLAVANGSGTAVVWPGDLSTSVTYKVVMRYDVDSSTNSTLWINPTDEITSTNAVATDVAPGALSISTFAFRQGGSSGTHLIDNVRVATTFAEALGIAGNTPPAITFIPGQSIAANTNTGALPFIIYDLETAAANLVLTNASSNPTLVPTNNIVFTGTDSNRTVTVTPAPNEQGTATVSVIVTDADLNSTTNSFTLTVGAPSISGIPAQVIRVDGVASNISFTVSDRESVAGDLTLSGTSAFQPLVPDANITFGGSGSNRTVTVTPAAGEDGTAIISVTVSDGTNTANTSFLLVVSPYLGLLDSLRFDTNGLLNGVGWTNISGATNEIIATNGAVLLSEAATEDIARSIPGGPFSSVSSGAQLYASFMVKFTTLPVSNFFAAFTDGGANYRARVFAVTNNASPGMFRLRIANASSAVPSGGEFPVDLALDNTYRIVICFNVSLGTSRLWVEPQSETDNPVDATDAPSPSSSARFALRQATGMGTLQFDNLRIGGQFADVAPYIPLTQSYTGEVATLTWPVAMSNVIAQGAPAIAPLNWTNLPNTNRIGSTFTLLVTNSASNGYYRLIAP